MNSKECNFSFETIFERTSDKFRRNVIRTNDLPRFRQREGERADNKNHRQRRDAQLVLYKFRVMSI
jgi:hypothetical protein